MPSSIPPFFSHAIVWYIVCYTIINKPLCSMPSHNSHPFIIANWKAYISDEKEARDLTYAVREVKNLPAHLILCPPAPFILPVQEEIGRKKIYVGAQDVSLNRKGAYTGEVTVDMLKKMKVSHCLVGHSERIRSGETISDVQKKIILLLSQRITPVVFFGEHLDGVQAYDDVKKILETICTSLNESDVKRIVFVYEPVWAIGGDTEGISPDVLNERLLFVRKLFTKRYNRKVAFRIPLLYGGSVKQKNLSSLLAVKELGGFLVGSASVHPSTFIPLIDEVRSHTP